MSAHMGREAPSGLAGDEAIADAFLLVARLRNEGIQLRVDGDRLLYGPPGKVTSGSLRMIRDKRAELLEVLRQQSSGDLEAPFRAALRTGRLVVCCRCACFTPRPEEQPDGFCSTHGTTWARVPFACPDFVRGPEGNVGVVA